MFDLGDILEGFWHWDGLPWRTILWGLLVIGGVLGLHALPLPLAAQLGLDVVWGVLITWLWSVKVGFGKD